MKIVKLEKGYAELHSNIEKLIKMEETSRNSLYLQKTKSEDFENANKLLNK